MSDKESGQGDGYSHYLAADSEKTGSGRKQYASAAERNTAPILGILSKVVPASGQALEIASGTGQHIAAFAAAFPNIRWQPSDRMPGSRASIAAWAGEAGVDNLAAPLDLDTTRPAWWANAGGPYDLIVCINMIHIAPWEACLGLMDGAEAMLRTNGALYLYGPYRRDGAHTAPSNEAFDRSLRMYDPAWGVRAMEDVAEAAAARGLSWERTEPMPANNFSLVFRKPAIR